MYGVVVKPKKYYDANWKQSLVDITLVKAFTTAATHFQKCNFYFEGKHLHNLHHTFHSFTNQWVCRAGFFCSNYRWPWQPTSHQSSYKNLFSAVLCISLQSVSACTFNNLQQPLADLSGNASMCPTGLQANVFSMSYRDDLATFVMLTLDLAYLTDPPAHSIVAK